MYAIRVTGKDRKSDNGREQLFPELDFIFFDLLVAIGAYVSGLYWAHTGIIYSFPESLTKEEYDLISSGIREYTIHSEPKTCIEYMHRGFIEKFGRYIYSDNLDLAGYEDIESLKCFKNDLTNIEISNAYIIFRCRDAVSWDIYTSKLNIIKLIRDNFNYTEDISI